MLISYVINIMWIHVSVSWQVFKHWIQEQFVTNIDISTVRNLKYRVSLLTVIWREINKMSHFDPHNWAIVSENSSALPFPFFQNFVGAM